MEELSETVGALGPIGSKNLTLGHWENKVIGDLYTMPIQSELTKWRNKVKKLWNCEESLDQIWSTFWFLVSVLWVSFSDLFRWQNPWDSVPFSDSVPACSGSGVLHLRQPDSCELSTPLERRSSSWQPGYRNVQKAPHSCRKILGKMVLVCTGDKHIWKTCGDPYISCNLIWSHDVV